MPAKTDPTVLSVGELNGQIRDTLSRAFPNVWVAGEISDLSRPRSGHLYFSLKDESGSIKAIIWRSSVERLRFTPEDGMQVLCRGDVDVYPPRGNYQLIVRAMQLQGEGNLQAQLRALQTKLEAEGLFAVHRKRPLPRFPNRIGVVTSISGAALRDFLEVVRRRWRHTDVVVIPTEVQGSLAAPQIARAIQQAASWHPRFDTLLVTRGGGSLEDLWAFNDERVVRAISDSPIPIVSAVGHEIDVTLSDLAADVRALTPSEAGERMVPDGVEIESQLGVCRQRLQALMQARLAFANSRLDGLANHPSLRDPFRPIRDRERSLDDLHHRVRLGVQRRLEHANQRIQEQASKLEALSPLQVLSRGYSVAQTEAGDVIYSADEVKANERIRIRLKEGQLLADIHETLPTESKQREQKENQS